MNAVGVPAPPSAPLPHPVDPQPEPAQPVEDPEKGRTPPVTEPVEHPRQLVR